MGYHFIPDMKKEFRQMPEKVPLRCLIYPDYHQKVIVMDDEYY